MKCVIYQFWEGSITPGNQAGVDLMKEYADRIGVDYVFELNPSWPKNAPWSRSGLGKYNPHYGAFKPIYDKAYDNYDYILFCDTDVVPRNKSENIFNEMLPNVEIGICEEHMQPDLRSQHSVGGGINSQNDLKWHNTIAQYYGNVMPKDSKGRHRVFNSGCVVYSKNGRKKAQEVFVDFREYITLMAKTGMPIFYQGDQNYLNAMLPRFNWSIMDYKWNSQMFFKPGTSGDNRPVSDYTDKNTNFIHVQLRGADHFTMHKLKEVIKYD